MKIALHFLPFAILSIVLAGVPHFQDAQDMFAPVLRSLAELPLVVGAVWLVVRLQDKQDAQVERIMVAFANRDQKKDESYQKLIDELLETIREVTKHTPHQ